MSAADWIDRAIAAEDMAEEPMGHRCHAKGCDKVVPHEMLMCRRHWFMVPKPVRDQVWDSYLTHGALSPPWLEAVRLAQAAVAAKEGR